jgi:hypothetical protein
MLAANLGCQPPTLEHSTSSSPLPFRVNFAHCPFVGAALYDPAADISLPTLVAEISEVYCSEADRLLNRLSCLAVHPSAQH